jgi:glycine cleavage system H protein
VLPADRRYSSGHTWAQPSGARPNIWRLGIDAFAASLIGAVRTIHCEPFEQLQTGETVCALDLGVGSLTIGTPVSGRVIDHNENLHVTPDLLVTAPYTEGWIADLIVDEGALDSLLQPDAARRQLRLDMRRFRRNIGFRLLAAAAGDLPDFEREPLNDLRHIIAGDHYVECIRDFVH